MSPPPPPPTARRTEWWAAQSAGGRPPPSVLRFWREAGEPSRAAGGGKRSARRQSRRVGGWVTTASAAPRRGWRLEWGAVLLGFSVRGGGVVSSGGIFKIRPWPKRSSCGCSSAAMVLGASRRGPLLWRTEGSSEKRRRSRPAADQSLGCAAPPEAARRRGCSKTRYTKPSKVVLPAAASTGRRRRIAQPSCSLPGHRNHPL